jgi:hypothetical protein
MGYDEEFSTVDLVVASGAETCAVDAFALSLIKAERQVRKVFTFLVYQFTAFGRDDVQRLRRTLAASKFVYFKGVVAGLDALSPLPVKDLIGPEYERLWERFNEFGRHRNKIFHGQLTADGLRRGQLLKNVEDIRLWCRHLGASTAREFGFDGFGRNSYRKSALPDVSTRLRVQIESHDGYAAFIRDTMELAKPARYQNAAKPPEDALR